MTRSTQGEAFLIHLRDAHHQEYVQKNPFLLGPDPWLDRELRDLCCRGLEIRRPEGVAFTHENIDCTLDNLVNDSDWSAILNTCAQLGLDRADARNKVNAWGWKVARAPRHARKILSIGCSTGAELVALRALFPDAELCGVDYAVAIPEGWRKALRLGELQAQPIEEYLASRPGRFDLVFSNHTLEHLSSPDDALRLVFGALLPGGALVSALPLEGDISNPFFADLLDIAEGRYAIDSQLDLEFINPGHAWKTNHTDLAAALHSSGFCDIRMFTRVNHPSYAHNHDPLHGSRFKRARRIGRVLERATLLPLRRGLRRIYPEQVPTAVARTYYRVASRCWFSRMRMLIELTHEVLFVATAGLADV